MDRMTKELIDELSLKHALSKPQYLRLLEGRDDESQALLAERASEVRRLVYGDEVFVRGLIEISSI